MQPAQDRAIYPSLAVNSRGDVLVAFSSCAPACRIEAFLRRRGDTRWPTPRVLSLPSAELPTRPEATLNDRGDALVTFVQGRYVRAASAAPRRHDFGRPVVLGTHVRYRTALISAALAPGGAALVVWGDLPKCPRQESNLEPSD